MELNLDIVKEEYYALPQTFKTVLLATVSPEGFPEVSYAPYVKDGDNYYVYISELAAHTRNMRHNSRVSLLFIENEDQAAHLFARKRISLHCTAYEVERDSEIFEQIMQRFQAEFGDFMNMLKTLQDFHLMCLHPYQGSFVQGFARAFALEGEHLDQIRHLNDRGHRPKKPSGKEEQID
jgi:putative heme iron utilization protein